MIAIKINEAIEQPLLPFVSLLLLLSLPRTLLDVKGAPQFEQ
jgi:hypothetical protein